MEQDLHMGLNVNQQDQILCLLLTSRALRTLLQLQGRDYYKVWVKKITVSAPMQPQGSIFQNWFLGEVLFKFDLHGVVFKMGFY